MTNRSQVNEKVLISGLFPRNGDSTNNVYGDVEISGFVQGSVRVPWSMIYVRALWIYLFEAQERAETLRFPFMISQDF